MEISAWDRLQNTLVMMMGSREADVVLAAAAQCVLEEREACAQIAEGLGRKPEPGEVRWIQGNTPVAASINTAQAIAAAIRARKT